MRTVLFSLAAAASALAVAAPASAQYWPAPQPQGYGYNNGYVPQGHAYGYQNAYGQIRSLQVRIDRLQGGLDRLAQRRIISRREYRELHGYSHEIEQRLRYSARNGLHPRERYDVERRIARLERQIAREANEGRWNRGGDYHGQSGYDYDRDRDGRDDRYEDDRGHDHD